MFNDVLNHANLVHWAEMGLVIFFVVFVLTTAWAMTRRKAEIEEWAALPLSGGHDAGDTERGNGVGRE